MSKLSDIQILALFKLKDLPEVTSVHIEQRGTNGVHVDVHSELDASELPIITAFKSIVTGIPFDTFDLNKHPSKDYWIKTFRHEDWPERFSANLFIKKTLGDEVSP